ncbi:bromodomain-containing protein 3-like [Prunus yedoensis var. nudiflora]|uniref:Bromodomain-containing protein 3-like n=1 Tax=Prunus yedoensis var. nudiflora TaxID=2094558 RepID=A0A314ZKP6_PRUYE|nr:bromodomain-containing protein 3-like [Prunus yedoensis var. nudiflora]
MPTQNQKIWVFDEICQTQKRKRSSRVSETQRNVAVEEKSTVGLPLCMGLASSATKNDNQESEEGFDEVCQTQKRKSSSRVSETQRNVDVEENRLLVFLCARVCLRLLQKMPTWNQKRVFMKSVKPRRGRGLLGFLRPNGRKSRLLVFLCAKSKVLDSLMNLGHASYFNKPVVDPVAENLPGYFDEIWRPMDLGTVKSKLERGVYSSTDGFAADVRLIFSNAFRYFPLGNRNLAAAKHLSGVFETQWKEAEEKMSNTACPPPTPPLPKRRPNGKSSSACWVLMQSQRVVGVSDSHSVKSTKDDLGTLFIMPCIRPQTIFLHVRLAEFSRSRCDFQEDDELQGQDEEAFLNGDWEEGEICWQEGDWEEGEIRS